MERSPDLASYPTCADCRAMGYAVPEMLEQLEAACGHAELIAFLKEFGGREASLTVRPQTCQTPAFRWLCRTYGPGRMSIPKGPAGRGPRTAFAVLKRLRQGHSLSHIAADLDCTVRAVSMRKAQLTRRGLLADPPSHPEQKDTSA